jgi:two-component system, OmpR family, KDP operon response regulator KdpE
MVVKRGFNTEGLMAHLRKKLEHDPSQPCHLLTEAGVGYRFVP